MEEGQKRMWSEQNQDALYIVLKFSKKIVINDNLCLQLHYTQVLGAVVMRIRTYSIYGKMTTKRIYLMILNLKSEHY